MRDLVSAVREVLPGGVQWAFEAVGKPETLLAGVRSLRPTGTLVAIVEPTVPVNPMVTAPPVASAPFQLSLVTVRYWPVCVNVPSQPPLTCCALGKVKASVQLVIGAPLLVIVMPPWKPPGQLFTTEYATVQLDAALAASGTAATTAPATSAPTPSREASVRATAATSSASGAPTGHEGGGCVPVATLGVRHGIGQAAAPALRRGRRYPRKRPMSRNVS